MPLSLLDSPVLIGLLEFSAPSTVHKVQCPWHYKTFPCSFLSFFSPTWVDSAITSLDRWPDHIGMGLVSPPLLCQVLQVLVFPKGMEQVLESWITVSHDGNWAESLSMWFPALVECAVGLCTARCWPVSHFGNVIHHWCYEKKLFHMNFGVSCLPANMH